jgi:integrase/recombinase XerD
MSNENAIINSPTAVPLSLPLSLPTGATNDAMLIELWLHGRPKRTADGYRADITRFRDRVPSPLNQVTLVELQRYADELDALGLQPPTRRRMLAAVKSLFAFGHRLGYLPFDTARVLRPPSVRDTLAERVLDEAVILRMIALEAHRRNAAIISLLYGGGLRVSELVGLRWRDVQARSNGAGQVTVLGKGAKTRTILLTAGVFAAICRLRRGVGDACPVFRSQKGGSIHQSQVLRIVKAAAVRAGVTRRVCNHHMRHSHASHAIERGAPIQLVQATLGHASVATTGRYLHARPNDSSSRYLPL